MFGPFSHTFSAYRLQALLRIPEENNSFDPDDNEFFNI